MKMSGLQSLQSTKQSSLFFGSRNRGGNFAHIRNKSLHFSRKNNLICKAASDTFKIPRWEVVWEYLTKQNLLSVKPSEAKQMAESGDWILVDIRSPELYEKSRPQGAVSVPLFQSVDWANIDGKTFLKSMAYMFTGVAAVEANSKFDEQLKAACGDKGVIMMCESGGSLIPTPNFPAGKTSRSFIACYRALVNKSASKVAHLDGGVYGWYLAQLPFDGEPYDTSNIGRTPNAAEAPSFK